MSFLLHFAWMCVLWLLVVVHGDELANGLMAALLPWLVLVGLCVTGMLVLLGYLIAKLPFTRIMGCQRPRGGRC